MTVVRIYCHGFYTAALKSLTDNRWACARCGTFIKVVLLVFAMTLAGWTWGDRANASVSPAQADRMVAVASHFAGHPVTIRMNLPGGGGATAFLGGNEILMGELVYRGAARGDSYGLFVLLHEAGHSSGILDEGLADCFALHHFREALEWWHRTKARARQQWADARLINREATAPYGCRG